MNSLNRLKRRPMLVGIVLVGASALAAVLVFAQPNPAAPAIAPAATTAAAPRRDPNVLRFAPGAEQLTAIATERVLASPLPLADVLSARVSYDDDATARIGVGVSGRIVSIAAAPGDHVRAGQVLAVIDSPDLGTAVADLDKARADEHRKQLLATRAVELVPGDAIAQKDVDALQSDLAQAHAETVRASQRVANLNPAGLGLTGQRMQLVSPVAGVVTERTATPGLEVNPSLAAPLFVVTDPNRLWLMIDVPEALLGRVQAGGLVAVDSDAYPGEPFRARIASAGQLVDPNTRRVTVRAVLDNHDNHDSHGGHRLLPEMFVRAHLLQTSGAGVAVPNSAIVNRGRYAYVYVQTAPAEFTRRRVTLATQGGAVSYVSDGLASGASIVTVGALLLDAELTARADGPA
jgi:cobalt-zinc-cadmium efflux system membrane fusion protein